MKKYIFCLILALLTCGFATAQDDTLTVDASTTLGPISPYVYGANLGLGSVIPPDRMEVAQALGIKLVRFGGGFSDQQEVRTTVVDLFIYQARALGAEPLLTVRLLYGTPEQAAEIVRYTNIEKDYNIRYWSIGNEPNLFQSLLGASSYTTEDLNREWRAIAEAMLEVDPGILFVGPDITQYVVLNAEPGNLEYVEPRLGGHPRDSQGRDWMRAFLRANGDLLEFVSVHRYPYPGAGGTTAASATIEGLRNVAAEWDTSIPNLRRIIREVTGRDIPIAVTEVNSNSTNSMGGPASLDSFYNAIWVGDLLGRLIRQQVEIVAYWDMQGDTSRGWSMMERYEVRPAYYTYIMYTHFGTELLAAESTDPHVSIYAARRDDGALTLMVVNLGDEEASKTLSLQGFDASGEAEVWRFDAAHNAEQIESQVVADGGTITVPGQSMTLYVVSE